MPNKIIKNNLLLYYIIYLLQYFNIVLHQWKYRYSHKDNLFSDGLPEPQTSRFHKSNEKMLLQNCFMCAWL